MKITINTILFCLVMFSVQGQIKQKTENVVLVTLDGFRWQELFHGADSSLMKQQKQFKDSELKNKYWRDDLSERRKTLLPFIWTVIAREGQLYGNRQLGCKVNVTNNQWFSYPGYNELLTGRADNERINSNDKIYNPNKNVLEFINSQPEYKGKVAAFTSWDVFPYIINDKRSGVFVSTGNFPIKGVNLSEKEIILNQLINALPNPLGDVRLDAFTFYYGLEYMKKHKPRVMYFAFDETDDFAHAGEYAAYLNSANYTDRFISELWNFLQSDAQYKGKTTLIISVDHGRGVDAESWKHHGQKIAEADQIWMAVIGPDTKPMGEIKGDHQLYQSQIAKTLAAFLNINYTSTSTEGVVVKSMFTGK
ncbi:alkaline phosphatase family protein [Chryseosolibacter indicus]|uniref:Alkaline phosphatase family protein n=1 Tax=Chryseosolibacter indicus TaxID=2782351 RepID=A0ABS5VUX0_9BACT|nr:alkaline phosphatase family protein [Chryseosolibacter indicus]MBT1704617.1 alkaline phosphatase family protein [Chryseosolibacter indicus]